MSPITGRSRASRFRFGEVTLGATAQLLRQRTAAIHSRVEAGLGLLDPSLTTERLRTVVARFHGFWAANEPQVTAWARCEPVAARGLDLARRRRTLLLAADVVALGGRPDDMPVAEPALAGIGTADVLGWLYVTEGSTLGGAVISRRLDRALPGVRLRSFTPYPEGPGPMWRAFVDALETWTAHDQTRAEQVAVAAQMWFSALEAWAGPVATLDPPAELIA